MPLKFSSNFDHDLEHKWIRFVLDHPHGNIFQTPYIYRIFQETANFRPIVIFMFDEAESLLGLVVAVLQYYYKGVGRSFSTRSIIYGGPLVKSNDNELLIHLLNEYDDLVRKDAVYAEIRNQWDTADLKNSFGKLNYAYSDHLDIKIDLLKTETELWAEMAGVRRKQIGRARKRGTTFSEIEVNNADQLKKAYSLVRDTYQKINLPVPSPNLFNAAISHMNELNYLKIFSACFENEIIAVRYILCFKNTLYDWYTGSDKNQLDKYPNDLLPWEIFRWGKQNGFQEFDFGGAGKPGTPYSVRDYKLKFGGKLINLGRYQKMHKPIIMKISMLGFKMLRKIKSVT